MNRSPPKKLTQKDQKEWKIPPLISSWKNTKSMLIPLKMRVESDGRNKRKTIINDRFAKISDALFKAEVEAKRIQR